MNQNSPIQAYQTLTKSMGTPIGSVSGFKPEGSVNSGKGKSRDKKRGKNDKQKLETGSLLAVANQVKDKVVLSGHGGKQTFLQVFKQILNRNP